MPPPAEFLTDEEMQAAAPDEGFLPLDASDERRETVEQGFRRFLADRGASPEDVEEGVAITRERDTENVRAIPSTLSMAGGYFGGAPGAGLGALVGTKIAGGSNKDASIAGVTNALVPAALNKAASAARPWLSQLLGRGSDKAIRSAMKVDRTYLEKMAGSKAHGINAMENEIFRTAKEQMASAPGLSGNPLTQRGGLTIQANIDDLANQYDEAVAAAPSGPIKGSGRKALGAVRTYLRKVASQGDNALDDIATTRGVMKGMRESPATSEEYLTRVSFPRRAGGGASAPGQASFGGFSTPKAAGWVKPGGEPARTATPGATIRRMRDLTPREQQRVIEANNDRLRGLFHGGSKSAETGSLLAAQRARTDALDDVAGTADITQNMKRLIDLRNVANIARRRAGARDPFGITDFVSLSAGNPVTLAGSVAMKPPALGALATLLAKGERGLRLPPSEVSELIRTALGISMAGHATPHLR